MYRDIDNLGRGCAHGLCSSIGTVCPVANSSKGEYHGARRRSMYMSFGRGANASASEVPQWLDRNLSRKDVALNAECKGEHIAEDDTAMPQQRARRFWLPSICDASVENQA